MTPAYHRFDNTSSEKAFKTFKLRIKDAETVHDVKNAMKAIYNRLYMTTEHLEALEYLAAHAIERIQKSPKPTQNKELIGNMTRPTAEKKECQRKDILRKTWCPPGSFNYVMKTLELKPTREITIHGINTKFYDIKVINKIGKIYGFRGGKR